MTFTGRPGRPAVTSWDGERIDLFARGPDDSLLHWTFDGGEVRSANLGGPLAGDPVVARRSADRIDVFARGVGGWLQHWWWDAWQGRMLGPETRPGWRLARDPVAVVTSADRVDVFARLVNDQLQHWWTVVNDWFGPEYAGTSEAQPALLAAEVGVVDVFAVINGELRRDRWADGTRVALPAHHEPPRGPITSPPTAVSWGPDRMDVFGVAPDGSMTHWGWSGTKRWHEEGELRIGRWYGPEPGVPGTFTDSPIAVARGPEDLHLVSSTQDRRVGHWSWNPGWSPVTVLDGPEVSTPAVLPLADRLAVYAWSLGEPALWWWAGDVGGWYAGSALRLEYPEATGEVETRWPPALVPTPTHLLRRAEDMVVLGVAWSGFRLVDDTSPAALEPDSPDARLVVTFPPQHVGEEVVGRGAATVPTLDPAVTDGHPVWRAWTSGPSRVVFGLRPGVQRVDLTAAGLLDALRGAPVLPGTDEPTDGATAIELPWRLIVSPGGRPAAEHPTAEHPAEPVTGATGAVGLWRSRLHAPGGMTLHAHDAGAGNDPIPVPLTARDRRLVSAQDTPATLDRLDLTAVGGTLTAHGRWRTARWDHDAVLGRDQHVRVADEGLLYPCGARVRVVEVTDREIDLTTGAPIAVLRKEVVLALVEQPPAGASPAFPFDRVELTVDAVAIDPPDPTALPRPPRVPDDLRNEVERLRSALRDLEPEFGDPVGGPPTVEALLDHDDPRLAGAARRVVELTQAVQAVEEHVAAVLEAREQLVDCHFWPKRGGERVRFPVRCVAGSVVVAFELPMVFVSDQELPETATMTAFDALTHPQVVRDVTTAFAESGAGVVEVPETAVALVPGEVTPVRALHVAGVWSGRGFRPRLGPPEGGVAHREQWAARVSVPALRSLLPGDPATHELAVRYSPAYEAGQPEQVPLRLLGEGVAVDFRRTADRSGALIAPVVRATGLSGAHGPVNVDGLRSMRPQDLFTPDATLLGFRLADLVGAVDGPPSIVTDLVPGQPPVVRMEWTGVTLTGKPPFVARPGATLALSVVSSAESTVVECRVADFALAFPQETPLLELGFTEVRYHQATGRPPNLEITGLSAKFLNDLELLALLQEKVGLGGALPVVETASDGIVARYALPVPDVRSGAFVMRNLTFSAAVTVPFHGDPVSVAVGFASRERPFLLTVLMFGGGGYVDVEFAPSGLRRLEVSLEFGAAVSVDFLIASGEAHVLGGIRTELAGGAVRITGYLRIGGSLEVLGLVSVSVELVLQLGYQTTGNRLVGRATLVIELDLTLYSDTLELDSGEWVIAGDDEPAAIEAMTFGRAADAGPTADDWDEYRRAFG